MRPIESPDIHSQRTNHFDPIRKGASGDRDAAVTGDCVGVEGFGLIQITSVIRIARRAQWAVVESGELCRAGGSRSPRNRYGHHPSGRYLGGQRLELELVLFHGRGEVLLGNGIGRAQGQPRTGRPARFEAYRIENRVQHPNALARRRAASGQGKIFFPSNMSERIRPTIFRYICPRRDTPNPHVFPAAERINTANPANLRVAHPGGKGILERRQMSGQQISLDADLKQTVHVLDPQRKSAGQPVIF